MFKYDYTSKVLTNSLLFIEPLIFAFAIWFEFNCIYILFTMLPWLGSSKGTFRSSSQVATCLPHTMEASHSFFYC